MFTPQPLSERLSTAQLADFFKVKETTIRHSLCTKGHYMGLRPVKAPNRFLYWSLTDAQRVLAGEVVEA